MPKCEICTEKRAQKLREFGQYKTCIECLDKMYTKLGKENSIVEIMAMNDEQKDLFVEIFMEDLEKE